MTSIQILGAGAIGSFLAASFALSGNEVAVVARGPRGARLRDTGLDFEQGGRRINIRLPIYADCADASRPDILMLCTKSRDLGAALSMVETYRDDPPILVTVQNGVDAPDQVVNCFPEAAILAARVHGFFELEGSAVRHVGVKPSIHFGAWNRQDAGAAELLRATLTGAAVANSISADIRAELWEKLLLASAIGTVGAALGLTAGQIMHDKAGRAMLEAAMREIALLAAARGINLPDRCVEATLAFVAGFPPDATSSLQRDLEAHRASEFDQLPGAVLRMAGEAALDMPVHRQLMQMLFQRGVIQRLPQG